MSAAGERRTLARLSVAAGSAATLAAAWLGVLRVDGAPPPVADGVTGEPALKQSARAATPVAPPVATPVASVVAQPSSPAGALPLASATAAAPASPQLIPAPATTRAATPSPSIAPPAPASPTPRVITRRSRAS